MPEVYVGGMEHSVRNLFQATCLRYHVERLTAMMTLALLEALFPNAPESSKLMAVRKIQSLESPGVDEDTFLHIAKLIKVTGSFSDRDVESNCRLETLRQQTAPRASVELPRLPSLADELVAREARIHALEAELADARRRDLSAGISDKSPTPPNADAIRLATALRWAAGNSLRHAIGEGTPARNTTQEAANQQDMISPTNALVTNCDVGRYLHDAMPQSSFGHGSAWSPSASVQGSRFSSLSRVLALERAATQNAFGSYRHM